MLFIMFPEVWYTNISQEFDIKNITPYTNDNWLATDCSKCNFKRKLRRMKIFESFMFYLLTERSFENAFRFS